MSLAFAFAPAWITAVVPSFDRLTPGWGATTTETRGSPARSSLARAMIRCAAGSAAIGAWLSWTTTCNAVAPSPEKSRAITARAFTD